MSNLLNMLTRYVPNLVLHTLLKDDLPRVAPAASATHAAVLFADISGFSHLADTLAKRGPDGAEVLSDLLNDVFDELISLITALGGDVAMFAGDALLALWPAIEEDPPSCIRRAAQCSLALQALFRDERMQARVPLSVRMGIGVGDIQVLRVGGVHDRWFWLVAGTPLLDAARASYEAEDVGRVVLSPQSWHMVRDQYGGHVYPTGCVRLDAVRYLLPPLATVPLPVHTHMEEALRSYIPRAVQARLEAGYRDWLGELRRVTVLFINLPDVHESPISLDTAQGAVHTIQSLLYSYEGSINKLSVDEKGTTLLAAFGLPPLAHEDDAVRAVQVALLIQASLRNQGLAFAIGITTGQVFCGEVGNTRRREYTMLGTVVNQAAYLMGAACNSILCDTATYQLSRSRIIFTQRSSIQIKSRSETLPAYMPERQAHRQARANQRLVGHNSERMLITTHLHALAHQQPAYPPAGKDTTGRATLIILEGEVGVGKSLLVDDMCAQAKSLGLLVLSGAGNAMEQQTSYYPWREVFRHLLGLDISSSREMQQQCVLNAVAHLPDLIPLVSLLNTILPLELPESAQAAALRGEPRAQALHRLSVQVLQASTTQAPAVLVLDDAHWLDPASWALVQAVVQQVPSLLVVLSIRQQHETVPTVLHSLLQHPQTHHLPLRALSLEETLTLACERLGTAQVPESLVSLIYDQAHGNPFFSEEVMYALRDAGLITVHNGVCHVASEAELSGALRSSETIQAVITSRLDRLSLNEQITLKIASVVGHVFTFRMLRDVHPMKPEQRRLARDVVSLQRLNFLEAAEHTPEPTYRFKQNITQEVVYNLMSFAQRRQIHRAVASWYEQNHAGHLGELAPLLSKHFSRAGDERALPYCICAGDEALAADATREALLHYTRAYELIRHLPTRQAHSLEPASIIHLFLQRGRALELESQYQQALANYRTLEDIAHQQQDRHMRLAALIARATLHALPTSTCDPPQVQQLLHNALELSRELK